MIILYTFFLFLLIYLYRRPYSKKFNFSGRNIVITGGASGIGYELSRILLEKNDVVLHIIDRDSSKLNTVIEQFNKTKVHAYGYCCDITDQKSLIDTVNEIKKSGPVTVLINNAGIVSGKHWRDMSVDEFQKTFQVCTLASFALIKLFLPHMIDSNEGMIVTVSSILGYIPGCKLIDYCTAKYASVGMHEALTLELNRNNKNEVHTLIIAPYAVNTGMFNGIFDSPKHFMKRFIFPILKPFDVAERILIAIENKETVVFIPKILTFIPQFLHILPTSFQIFLLKLFGADSGMDTFRGRG